jgi:hypothetical protein
MRVAGLLLVALFALAAPASADVRAGAQGDPRDQLPSLSGPSAPDVEQVRVAYDTTTGAVAATLRFYEPVPSSTNQNFSLRLYDNESCTGFTISLSVFGGLAASDLPGSLTASGFAGSLAMARGFSADRREVTWIGGDPRLAGRDLRCFDADTNIPDKIGHCSDQYCTHIWHSWDADPLDQPGSLVPGGVFPPPLPADDESSPPKPACDDGLDNDGDGRRDVSDPGCRGLASGTDETDPPAVRSSLRLTARRVGCSIELGVAVLRGLTPADRFPFDRWVLTVKGHGQKVTRRLEVSKRYRVKHLGPGRFVVSGYYAGDRWRLRSAVGQPTRRLPPRVRV